MTAPEMVSVVIPCRDEQRFIAACLDSVVATDFPKERLEVLVVDGMSVDRTREIVGRYAARFPFIRMIDNPRGSIPAGLNIGVAAARGETILRMDAHALYDPGYIRTAVEVQGRYGADNVGGVMTTRPRDDTLIGRAIALALASRFGVGGARFRVGTDGPRWVDTVFGGCYRRDVFQRLGGYDETVRFSEDFVFNARLRRAGGRILMHPAIRCAYYARSDLRSFARQSWRNGAWAVRPWIETGQLLLSWRHLVPLALVGALLVAGPLAPVSAVGPWALVAIAGSYGIANLAASAMIALRERDARLALAMPLVFALLHGAYGLGSVGGGLRGAAGWTARALRPRAWRQA